jgi:hypothetical protein
MRWNTLYLKLVLFAAMAVALAVPCNATSLGVKGASNYGAATDFFGCMTGNTAVTSGNPCEGFLLTPVTTVSVGALNYNVYQFVSGNGSDPGTVLDIVDLGPLAPGSTFSFSSIFAPTITGVFGCGDQISPLDGSTQATDSGTNPMAGPCTGRLTGAPDISQNGTSFTVGPTFNNSFPLTDLVLEAPDPVTATPEPASLALVGTGLVVLLGKRVRRRKQA